MGERLAADGGSVGAVVSETITCSHCGRDRPTRLFRGRHKIVVPEREMICRTCQAEWWRAGERRSEGTAPRPID